MYRRLRTRECCSGESLQCVHHAPYSRMRNPIELPVVLAKHDDSYRRGQNSDRRGCPKQSDEAHSLDYPRCEYEPLTGQTKYGKHLGIDRERAEDRVE